MVKSLPVVPSEAAHSAAPSRDLFFPEAAPEKVPPLRSAALRCGRDDGDFPC